jgi:hypothetical protein
LGGSSTASSHNFVKLKKQNNMKNIQKLIMLGGLATIIYSCGRPEYPKPQVNQATIAPLPRTSTNNARIMVFNALVDLNPDDDNALGRLRVLVDGEEMENFDGSPAFVWSRQFRVDGSGNVVPLVRKYPMPASNTNINVIIPPATTPSPQTSQYLPAASAGFTATQTAFTNFAAFVPASIINGVEVTPAQQERGIFIPPGRRDITFKDRNGELVPSTIRANTNLNPGSLTSIFLRGRLGTTSGADEQGVTIVTENISSPTTGFAAIRFLNLAPDLGAVRMLTATNTAPVPYNVAFRPMLSYPDPPANTRFRLDEGKTPFQKDSLRFVRDSLMSRRGYNALNATVTASANPAITIERTVDGTLIPNYSNTLSFTSYRNIPAGVYTFNFYTPNRLHTANNGRVLSTNVPFTFLTGGVYTIVLHGTVQTGYKCDIIRMN